MPRPARLADCYALDFDGDLSLGMRMSDRHVLFGVNGDQIIERGVGLKLTGGPGRPDVDGFATVQLQLDPTELGAMYFTYRSPFWLRERGFDRARFHRTGDL